MNLKALEPDLDDEPNLQALDLELKQLSIDEQSGGLQDTPRSKFNPVISARLPSEKADFESNYNTKLKV